jgi:hypothetical protein
MSAYKILTPGNCPEENIQHTEHGESLKSSVVLVLWQKFLCGKNCSFSVLAQMRMAQMLGRL